MNNDPIALQLADALLRNNRQSINIEAAAELRMQNNALINADDTRNRLIRRVTELEARIAELEARPNAADIFKEWVRNGEVDGRAAGALYDQERRIAELEAQLEAIGAGGVSALRPCLHQIAEPARVPLTDAQIKSGRRTLPYDIEDAPEPWAFFEGVRFAELHHGITAQC